MTGNSLRCPIISLPCGNKTPCLQDYGDSLLIESRFRTQRSIQAMRRTLVEPGVPNGTPAVMTTRWPEPAISSR